MASLEHDNEWADQEGATYADRPVEDEAAFDDDQVENDHEAVDPDDDLDYEDAEDDQDDDGLADDADDDLDDDADDDLDDDADDDLDDEEGFEADDDLIDEDLDDAYEDDEDDDGSRAEDEEAREEALDEGEETEFATVATGVDINEAKRTALAQLRKIVPWVTEADVEYEVVEEGARGGFFGRGRKGAEVEARVRPSAKPADVELEPLAEDLREFLSEVVERMGLDAQVDVHDDGEAVVADLSGPDLGILIGRHGQTIDALQYICAIAVNRRRKSRRRVVVDAEGYRDRRASSLHAMADRVAQRVSREREAIMLKPMSAAERKVIHLRLKDDPRVETSSEGQEPNRAVVVSPKSTR